MPEKPSPSQAAAPSPLKKPPAPTPPRPSFRPLKPPPYLHRPVHFRQPQKSPHSRRHCSCRRVCCLAAAAAFVFSCLLLAAGCLAYVYYRPRLPSFHLYSLTASRLHVADANADAGATIDTAVAVRIVSWNPNEKNIAFECDGGEGTVSVADDDGDVGLGDVEVAGFEQPAKRIATVRFVVSAKGVVVDEAVAARVRSRWRQRQLRFKAAVDAKIGVKIGGIKTTKVPIRIVCGEKTATVAGGGGGAMSKCEVYLLRVRWLNLN